MVAVGVWELGRAGCGGAGVGACCPSGWESGPAGCHGAGAGACRLSVWTRSVLSVGENRGVLSGLGGWPCTAVVRAALGGLARPTGSAADSPTARRRVRCAHARLPALAPSRSPAPRDLPTRPGPGACPRPPARSVPGPPADSRDLPAPAGRPATRRAGHPSDDRPYPGGPATCAARYTMERFGPPAVAGSPPVAAGPGPGGARSTGRARTSHGPTAPRPHGPTAARGPCRRAGARGHRAGQAPAPPPGRPREGTGE